MSLLKTNEIQNYNGSSLTLTASTVSTSAQLNTGGNISVTGSLNVSDDSTTRTNLGLGTIATQDSDSITVTGGSVTGTEIDLKSSGATIYKSDGTTAVLSESGGVVTLNNITVTGGSVTGTEIDLKSSGATIYKSDGTTAVLSESGGVVTLNNITAGSNISGIGQLIGMSFSNGLNANGNIVTLESSKNYDALLMIYSSGGNFYFMDLAYADVDASGNVTVGKYTTFAALLALQVPGGTTNQVQIKAYNSTHGYSRALIFERGSTFDAS